MKTPSTFLYDLVGKLTKSEKRYIKIQAGVGAKDYIQLMDALIAQPVFDETQLVEDHRGANFVKNLAVNKRYLYELILKSLTNFGRKKWEDTVLERMSAANILIEKGLYTAAYRELQKGQKIVLKYDLFDLQILLCGVNKKLLSLYQFKNQDERIRQVFDTETECLRQLQNTNEYWFLSQQITRFQMQFQKVQNQEQQEHLETLTQQTQFQNKSLATNFKSKLYFYQANAGHQFMLGNVKKAYEINAHLLDLLEAHPHFLKIYAERYLGTLNNMLIDSLVIGDYNVLEKGINRLVLTPERPEFKAIKNIESRVFRQRYLLLINWSLSQKDFEKAMEWIPQIEEGLRQFGTKIEKHHRITFYYLIAYLLFINGRYEKSLKWTNRILNDPKEEVVKEIFHFTRILNLVIHYELGNPVLLQSLLLSTPKYIRSRRPIYATEKALFRFLGKLLNSVDKTEKQQLTDDFKNEINELSQNPKERRVFNYLDLRLWVK